jgi:C-terminal processing protease CtpA/Prc
MVFSSVVMQKNLGKFFISFSNFISHPQDFSRVFVSDIAKNSSAAICGLRDGDHIIEVNGINIQTLTYETILNKIRLHMEHENLELLVLDKKSERWYRRRKYPITSQTLPTIVHIEPIINQINTGMESS